ncbi:MAG: hypothetical protein Q7T41_01195 [Candidatus Saccharibacteria bacterium]|nr:hypothetical protein [Candidatus Saccharibacteria bacterium]
MAKIYEPSNTKNLDTEVGFGHQGGEWFVGIRPPISSEALSLIGVDAVQRREIMDADGSSTGATVLKFVDLDNEIDARGAGVGVTLALRGQLKGEIGFYAAAVEMAPGTAPFQDCQPRN